MAIESETVETLKAAALQLTAAERARLVDRLIATLYADLEVEEASTTKSSVGNRNRDGTVSLLLGPETLIRLKAEFE